jgi:protein TonB
MGAPDTAQGSAAVRFAPYIEELREFFASASLRYGSPEDIIPITERIESSQQFADDLSSMVRSIVLRQGGEMAHSQLLEILAIAIGGETGEKTDQAPQEYVQPLRNLLSFLTGVLRKPWNEPPAEPVHPFHTFHERGEILEFPTGPRYLGLRSHGQAAAISAAAERAARAAARFDDGATHDPGPGSGKLEPIDHYSFQSDPTAEPLQPDPAEPVPDWRRQREVPDLVGEPAPPERSMFDPHTPADQAVEEPDLAEETSDRESSTAATWRLPTTHPAAEHAATLSSSQPPRLHIVPKTVEAAADAPSWRLAADAVRGIRHAPPLEAPVPPPPVELPHPPVISAPPVQRTGTEPDPTALAFATTGSLAAHSALSAPPLRQSPPAPPLTGTTKVPAVKAPDFLAALPPYRPHVPRTPAGILVAGAAMLVLAGVFAASFHRSTELIGKQVAEDGPARPHLPVTRLAATTPSQTVSPAASPATSEPAQKLLRVRRASLDDDEDADDRDVAPPYSTPIPGQPAVAKPSAYGSQMQPAVPVIRSSRPPANEIASTSAQPPGSVAVGRGDPVESYAGGQPGLHPGVGAAYRSSERASGDVPRSGRASRGISDDSDMIDVSSGMMAGYLVSAPKPDYPGLAKIAHIGGPVVLQAVVAKNGTVLATHVLSGHRLLRGAAQDAVRRWRFRPYVMDGHPVEVSTIVTVRFNQRR